MAVKSDYWVSGVFHAMDSLDATAVMKLFGDDPSLRFGNAEPAVGRDAVEATVASSGRLRCNCAVCTTTSCAIASRIIASSALPCSRDA
jgi:hypothetical protein